MHKKILLSLLLSLYAVGNSFAEPTEENKLAIDSIFNVETDQIEEDEDASNEEHLAEDFDQYINTLENKEA